MLESNQKPYLKQETGGLIYKFLQFVIKHQIKKYCLKIQTDQFKIAYYK